MKNRFLFFLPIIILSAVFGFSNRVYAADMAVFATSSTQALNQNDTAIFDVSIFDHDGTACPTCTYSITTSPTETVTEISKVSNRITGSFPVTRKGTYSIIISVTDSSDNTSTTTNQYFVDSSTGTIRYYFRDDYTTHEQIGGGKPPYGTGNDNGSLLLTPPQSVETRTCGIWVQASPDQLPIDFPISSLLSSFSTHVFLYNQYTGTQPVSGSFGIKKTRSYDATSVDLSTSVTTTNTPTANNLVFSNINWKMNSSNSWYWLGIKYIATLSPPYRYPRWQSTPSDPSYIDWTYKYTTTPHVGMTNSNAQWGTNIELLSATASTTDSNSYSIILQNFGLTNDPAFLTIPNNSRPFQNTLSTIDSTGTTTLRAIVPANNNLTIENVPLTITPTSGAVGLNIINWNPTNIDYKNWTEIGSTTANITVSHTITNLSSNTSYKIRVNNVLYDTISSDSEGSITFSYTNISTFPYNQIEVYPATDSPSYISHIKYWYSTGSTDWNNLENWYTDADHNTEATELPTTNDITIITGSNRPTANTNTWIQPTFIDAQTANITFSGDKNIYVDIIGNITLSSNNYGTIIGNMILNSSAKNYGTIIGDATFNSSAKNHGIIMGNATFNNSGSNYNIVIGDATFSNSSYNEGTIIGNAKFTNASDGIITMSSGGIWGSGTSNAILGEDNIAITQWIFNDSSFNNSNLTGSTTFNDTSSNQNIINGNATFNNSSSNRVIINGDTTFNGSSSNQGPIVGNVTFNDSSNNESGEIFGDAIFNTSVCNGGKVNGNAIFNNSLGCNWATITGTAKFSYANEGVIKIIRDFSPG